MLMEDGVPFSLTADVVTVGFGAAGAVAAMTAHDNGSEVLILEKQSVNNYLSNSSMSGGFFFCLDNIPAAINYMELLSKVDEGLSWTDKGTIRVWAEYTSQNKRWLEKLGAKVTFIGRGGEHLLPGSECIEVYSFPGLGYGLMKFLKHHIEERAIHVMYDTKADRLLTNTSGEVIGVRALRRGELIDIKASKAVIMAPGGFEFNEQMKLNFLKVFPTYFAGSPANTGDGIRMVQEVGAALWHMNCCSAGWVLKFPEFSIGLGPNFGGSKGFKKFTRNAKTGYPCGFIIVDKHGKRYTNEIYKRHCVYYELSLYDSQKLEYPRIPSYWVFDHKRIESGPLPMMFYGPMLYRLYRWSKDNREEIQKGWIIEGEDIEKLAYKLEMDPSALKKTVANYNFYCSQKEDTEFNRPSQHLVPLKDPPFFAVKIWPGSANTQGGPRHNDKAQVLNMDGEPIPRLYAAGEFGSIYGMLYPGTGGNLAECIAFGRIAGENAAAQRRW